MGAHLIDFPHWALRLGLPTSIQTISTPFNEVCYPMATTTYYEFPARRGMPAVKLTWYDGGFMPAFPDELAGEPLDPNGGILYVGSKGKMLQQPYAPHLLPMSRHNSFKAPRERLAHPASGPRDELDQHHQRQGPALVRLQRRRHAHRDHAARHRVAPRQEREARDDGATMRITNNATANQYLTRDIPGGVWAVVRTDDNRAAERRGPRRGQPRRHREGASVASPERFEAWGWGPTP